MSYDWTLQTSGPNTNWYSLASNNNGTRVAGCGNNFNGNLVYTGLRSESTWSWTQQTSLPNVGWNSITSNSDGSKLAVCGSNVIYTGIFSNSNWTWTQQQIPSLPKDLPNNIFWSSIASDSIGNNLVVVDSTFGYVYTGAFDTITSLWTWTQQTNGLPIPNENINFYTVASNSTCTNLVVVGDNINGYILYTGSFDTTTSLWTWKQQQNVFPDTTFNEFFEGSVSSNSTGNTIAVTNGNYLSIGILNGSTWTWTHKSVPSIKYPGLTSVAFNSEGTNLVLGAVNTYIYTVTLDGSTWIWTKQTSPGNQRIYSVASDSTGNNLFAGINGGMLNTDAGYLFTATASSNQSSYSISLVG